MLFLCVAITNSAAINTCIHYSTRVFLRKARELGDQLAMKDLGGRAHWFSSNHKVVICVCVCVQNLCCTTFHFAYCRHLCVVSTC